MSTRKAKGAKGATLVFDLTKSQFGPVVDAIVRERVADFEVAIEHKLTGHVGYSAEKAVATLNYVTETGRAGKADVLVKRFKAAGPHEAHHYAGLSGCRAPIPRLYAALTDADGRETIFLEYLRSVDSLHPFDDFLADGRKVRAFLTAIARFNAVKPPEEYAARLPKWDYAGMVRGAAATLRRVWDSAAGGKIGDPLRDLCSTSKRRLGRLEALIGELVEPVKQMRTGLCHNDWFPDNACWRPETGELLVVDLESVGIAPRFRDVATWLGAPDGVQSLCAPKSELAGHYLRECHDAGGDSVPVEQFEAETRVLWMAGTFEMLWFSLERAMDGRVDWTDDREEGRRVFRESLHRALSGLLEYAK